MNNQRSCFNCKHFKLCFMRRRIFKATMGVDMFNIDGDAAPKQWTDIIHAVGQACMEYKYQKGN